MLGDTSTSIWISFSCHWAYRSYVVSVNSHVEESCPFASTRIALELFAQPTKVWVSLVGANCSAVGPTICEVPYSISPVKVSLVSERFPLWKVTSVLKRSTGIFTFTSALYPEIVTS